ncbi:hypothetical protein ACJJTC_016272 [Scirpophaga incertulas]
MKCFVAICLLALTASSRADGVGGLVYAPGHASADYYAYPRYAFEYAVKDPHTGDNKAQWEKRDGDVVKGAYSLVEPDGSLRVVEYYADDKSGFNAVVKRVGPNLHPTGPVVAPIYKAPIPILDSHGPVVPISVGPVAKLSGLASAPLITGPVIGGAVSSASIYRDPSPVVVKAPIAPIVTAPIAHGPVLTSPIAPAPMFHAPAPYIPTPIIKPGPIITGPLPGPVIPVGLTGIKTPMIGPGYLEDVGHGLLTKAPLLPPLGLGGYDFVGYKH